MIECEFYGCHEPWTCRVSVAMNGMQVEDRLLCEVHYVVTRAGLRGIDTAGIHVDMRPDPRDVGHTCPSCLHAPHTAPCERRDHEDDDRCGCEWPRLSGPTRVTATRGEDACRSIE